jgi:hypothetical protein
MKGKSKENAALYQYKSQTNSKAVSRQAILASVRNWLCITRNDITITITVYLQ